LLYQKQIVYQKGAIMNRIITLCLVSLITGGQLIGQCVPNIINAVNGSPFSTGANPMGVTFNKTGMILANTNETDNTMSLFSVASNGMLTALTALGSPFSTGTSPRGIDFSPNGSFIAVANFGSSNISLFRILTDGTVQSLGTTLAGATPQDVAFNRDGTLLAVTNFAADVRIFTVAANGTLTLASTTTLAGVYGADFSPLENLLVVSNASSGEINVFDVNSDGTINGTPDVITVGTTPHGVAFNANGSRVGVANSASTTFTLFKVTTTGLVLIDTYGTGTTPEQVSFSPNGKLVAVANSGSANLSLFRVQLDGSLIEDPLSPFSTGATPMDITFSPGSSLLVTANAGPDNLSVFCAQSLLTGFAEASHEKYQPICNVQ
jgi:DNA-binding beta-propeller fold protein YncE